MIGNQPYFYRREYNLSSLQNDSSSTMHTHKVEDIVKNSNKEGVSLEYENMHQGNMYRSFFKRNKSAILLVDAANSNIVDANEAACKYYGWSFEELTSKKMCQINALPDEEMKVEIQKAAEEKRDYFSFKHRLESGEIRDVEIDSGQMVLNSQNFTYYIIHDVTEHKIVEDNLKRNQIHFRTVRKLGNIGTWELDLTSGKIDYSYESRKIFGLTDEHFSFENILEIILPQSLPVLDKALNDLIEKNSPYNVHLKIKRKNDGKVRIIHSMAELHPERRVIVGMIRDVTRYKQYEESLAEEVSWRRILMEQSRDGIVILDSDGSVFEANPRFAEMIGYTLEEVHKLHVWDWDAHYTREQVTEMFKRADNKGILHETLHRRKDGTLIDVEINASAAIFGDRKLSFCACRDITERKRSEEEILNAKLVAETANKSKDEFLATISHELRTPLNSIIGFSDVLLEEIFGSLNNKQTMYISNISKSGKHLLSLINDILDLSKIQAGEMELNYEEFDVSNAIAEVKTTTEPLAAKKCISMDIKIDPQLVAICADETRFRQILYNLTSNAIKFTPEKGNVTIETYRFGDMIQVSVKDTGIGMSTEDMNQLFRPFRQLNPYLTREFEGTGLGLVLVKKFIEMHGGKIRVESKIGEGSIFSFVIPPYPKSMNS